MNACRRLSLQLAFLKGIIMRQYKEYFLWSVVLPGDATRMFKHETY